MAKMLNVDIRADLEDSLYELVVACCCSDDEYKGGTSSQTSENLATNKINKIEIDEAQQKIQGIMLKVTEQEMASLACHILLKHLGDHAKVILPMEIIERLHKQKFFSELAYSELKTSNGILTEVPLDELHIAIFNNPIQLKQFAYELIHFSKTEPMAIAILKEYGKGEQILRSKELLVQQLITHNKMKKTDLLPTTSQTQDMIKEEEVEGFTRRKEAMIGTVNKMTSAKELDQKTGASLDNLRDVSVLKSVSFIIQGDSQQFFNWDRYGLRVIIPKGTLAGPSETCEVAMKALVAGPFQFQAHTEADFVSAVYGICISRPLLKPVTVEMQHCVDLCTQDDSRYLTFVKASIDQLELPYIFQVEDGGQFHANKQSGSIPLSQSSLMAIVKFLKPVAPFANKYRTIEEKKLNISEYIRKRYDKVNKEMSHKMPNSVSEKETGVADSKGNTVTILKQSESYASELLRTMETIIEGEFSFEEKKDELRRKIKILTNFLTTIDDMIERLSDVKKVTISSNQSLPESSPHSSPQNDEYSSSGSYPDNRYVCQVVYTVKPSNVEWVMHFLVAKRLNVLLEYIKEHLPKNAERDVDLSFTFKETYGSVSLVLNSEQQYNYNGWHISPHKNPVIHQREVDLFGFEVSPYIPRIPITISASIRPNIVPKLDYCVPLKGIEPENWIRIIRCLSLPTPNNGSTVHENASMTSVSFDLSQDVDIRPLIRSVKKSLTEHNDKLYKSSRSCLDMLARKMHSVHLINQEVQRSPKFSDIIDEFTVGMDLLRSQSMLEEHCAKFLTICIDLGGSMEKVGRVLCDEWVELGMKLNIDLHFV